MPYQIENRMLVDSEFEHMEHLQMRRPDEGARRLRRILDEVEYGRMEEEDYESLRN